MWSRVLRRLGPLAGARAARERERLPGGLKPDSSRRSRKMQLDDRSSSTWTSFSAPRTETLAARRVRASSRPTSSWSSRAKTPRTRIPGRRFTFRAATAAVPITTVCSRRHADLATPRPSSRGGPSPSPSTFPSVARAHSSQAAGVRPAAISALHDCSAERDVALPVAHARMSVALQVSSTSAERQCCEDHGSQSLHADHSTRESQPDHAHSLARKPISVTGSGEKRSCAG